MSVNKTAQLHKDFDDFDVVMFDPSEDLEVNEPGSDVEFHLELLPGAEEDEFPAEIEVEEPEKIEISEPDPWDWQSRGLKNFLAWLTQMSASVPRHSGRDISGVERAIAYLEMVRSTISKAVRSDLRDELDVAKIENVRDEIQNGIDRLEARKEQIEKAKRPRKKKGESEDLLVKNAQKISGVQGRVIVTVPLLISSLARACINGSVSAGHDIEDSFKKLADKYKLNDREKTELKQLIEDMGYAVRRDRGLGLDDDFDPQSSDNVDWAANYPA